MNLQAIINNAPSYLDSLKEISDALLSDNQMKYLSSIREYKDSYQVIIGVEGSQSHTFYVSRANTTENIVENIISTLGKFDDDDKEVLTNFMDVPDNILEYYILKYM